jgi:tetratricopeptide (TPR) repeat protein
MLRSVRVVASIAAFFGCACILPGSDSGWTLARNARFELYLQNGSGDGRELMLRLERLQVFFERLSGLNVEGRPPIQILVFRSPESYQPFRLEPNSDSYYVGNDGRDYIVLSGDTILRDAAHEYWHFVEHARAMRLPAWLNEGLGEFFSTLRFDATGAAIAGTEPAGLVANLRTQEWIALPDLLSLTPDGPLRLDRDRLQLFYNESWALAHMLMLSPDYSPRFQELTGRLAAGTTSRPALESTYSKPLDEIGRDLRAWVQNRAGPAPLGEIAPIAAPGAIQVSQVSESVIKRMLPEIMAGAGKRQQAEALYRDLARENPGDPQIPAALAMLALRENNRLEAQRQWRIALERGIKDARMCFRFSQMAQQQGLPAADVRSALERAVLLDHEFDDALFQLALIEKQAGELQSALKHLRAMRHVGPTRAFVYWSAMSDLLNDLGRRQEAIDAAKTAALWAATPHEADTARSLEYMASTDLTVRMYRDAEGKAGMETARVPHDSADWNPFIERADRVKTVEGRLREIECEDGGNVFIVIKGTETFALVVPDPTHVQMRNAPGEFICGPQDEPPVRAVFAETAPGKGVLRGLEFR